MYEGKTFSSRNDEVHLCEIFFFLHPHLDKTIVQSGQTHLLILRMVYHIGFVLHYAVLP